MINYEKFLHSLTDNLVAHVSRFYVERAAADTIKNITAFLSFSHFSSVWQRRKLTERVGDKAKQMDINN
jgi:hypothetical protein